MPIVNGSLKSNPKVVPLNSHSTIPNEKHDIGDVIIFESNGTKPDAVKENLNNDVTKENEKDNNELQEKKKPEGPKLKAYQIVCTILLPTVSS